MAVLALVAILFIYTIQQACSDGTFTVLVTYAGYDIDTSRHQYCDDPDSGYEECDYRIDFTFKATMSQDPVQSFSLTLDPQKNKWCGGVSQVINWDTDAYEQALAEGMSVRIQVIDEESEGDELLAEDEWVISTEEFAKFLDACDQTLALTRDVPCVEAEGGKKCDSILVQYQIAISEEYTSSYSY